MLDGTIRCSEKGVVMSSMPALRLRGRGDRVRLRKIGRWDRDPLVK